MKSVHQICFSPTGTTRKIIEAVTEGLTATNSDFYDITDISKIFEQKFEDGIGVIGCPVYAGRIPEDFLKRIESISAKDIPAIVIVLYGNREFEDALVELRDVVAEQGFRVIAAGAFIGEHSFSTSENQIAAGRPNEDDLRLAVEFGQQVAVKLANEDNTSPKIDGNIPYKERGQFGGVAPETDSEKCTLCGECASVCPKGIITVNDEVITNAADCIMCCACVKACAFDARIFNHPLIKEKREKLSKMCGTPKVPKVFL